MPVEKEPQMENIIDQKIDKKRRRKSYFEYFVKWKGRPAEDSNWVTEVNIQKDGRSV